jgi:branched-chain amino acid transport system substrate-binding protein
MRFVQLAAAAGAAAFAALAAGLPARAQTAEPIKIGVPMPLTGVLGGAGQFIAAGIRFAAEEANKSGGVLGRPIELLIEDTKSEPNTAATIASKMATQDKVYAFVGGYGSTADFALLQSVKRYDPIFVHAASSSVRLEQAFGKEPWYHHVYIWDYHRQKAATAFFESIQPKPETVALAYEDGLYGSDAAKYSEEYMAKAGFKLVMKEPFKSGSPDFSPILNRVKALNPDVFFVVAYSGDNIQIVRQARSLNIRPKLTMTVNAGEKRSDFGDFGEGIANIGEWAREQRTEGLEPFITRFEAFLPSGATLQASMVQGYTSMYTLIGAIKKAGSLDRDAVLKALGETTYDTPYGKLQYKPSDGGALHQLLSNENMIVVQYRAQGQEVVWPPEKANGKLVYPAP